MRPPSYKDISDPPETAQATNKLKITISNLRQELDEKDNIIRELV